VREAETSQAEGLPEHEGNGVFHVGVDDAVGGPDQAFELFVQALFCGTERAVEERLELGYYGWVGGGGGSRGAVEEAGAEDVA
jgi:hypothetical protein